MPTHCVVIGCKSRGYRTGRTFSSFPMLKRQSARTLAITQARQNAWLKALNRSDFFPRQYQHARVCDLHFVSGKSVKFTDVNHTDWVPTLRLGYDKEILATSTSATNAVTETLDENTFDATEYLELSETTVEMDGCVETNKPEVSVEMKSVANEAQTNVKMTDAAAQTDGTITGISSDIVSSYIKQIKLLEEMLVVQT